MRPPATQFEVADPPGDAITAVAFAPDSSSQLVVSSWDAKVYLYHIAGPESATLTRAFEHRAPVLGVCFGADQNEAFSACMDHTVARCACPFHALLLGTESLVLSHFATPCSY